MKIKTRKALKKRVKKIGKKVVFQNSFQHRFCGKENYAGPSCQEISSGDMKRLRQSIALI